MGSDFLKKPHFLNTVTTDLFYALEGSYVAMNGWRDIEMDGSAQTMGFDP